jgi:hypothetical protein
MEIVLAPGFGERVLIFAAEEERAVTEAEAGGGWYDVENPTRGEGLRTATEETEAVPPCLLGELEDIRDLCIAGDGEESRTEIPWGCAVVKDIPAEGRGAKAEEERTELLEEDRGGGSP